MITYGGTWVTQAFGVPSLNDIAVAAMRIPRFCGSGGMWWPVGMHLLLVADLVPPELEADALLHDAAEVCVNDIPSPMKTRSQRALEHRIMRRIYANLGLRMPTPDQEAVIKCADIRALNIEGCADTGPRGFGDIQPCIVSDIEGVKAFRVYLDMWNPTDALNANGYWPNVLEKRLRRAVTRLHRELNATKSTQTHRKCL